MSYDYQIEKLHVFTEEGQVKFLAIRDKIQVLLKSAGAFAMGKVADSWEGMACVDRLIELGEVKEICRPDNVPGQYRIFVDSKE